MKPDFLTRFDGTKRKPRQTQIDTLNWLADKWDTHDVFFIKSPVGSGKSAISRAIQIATGAAVVTPSNVLVKQYTEEYPQVNSLKGKAHYTCSNAGVSCKTWVDEWSGKACDGCPYIKAKTLAVAGVPTFFNPMSLYYLNLQLSGPKDDKGQLKHKFKHDVIVVDEAHTLYDMIKLLVTKSFRRSEYDFPMGSGSEFVLEVWLKSLQVKLNALAIQYKDDTKRLDYITEELYGVGLILDGVKKEPENIVYEIKPGVYRGKPETFLHISPIDPPLELTRKMINGKKLVFMSGTLFKSDIEFLSVGKLAIAVYDSPSPIPSRSRPVLYKKSANKYNRDTDPALIVADIEAVIRSNPNLNTIIHTTYGSIPKLLPHFTMPIIYNGKDNKEKKIAEFLTKGGVFLAAGCSEGLDLKYDLCRLNIIPKLPYPNLGELAVKKRFEKADGKIWYLMQTFKTLMQQVGRSTRAVDDWSKTYILDNNFPRCYFQLRDLGQIPRSFGDSIIWKDEL